MTEAISNPIETEMKRVRSILDEADNEVTVATDLIKYNLEKKPEASILYEPVIESLAETAHEAIRRLRASTQNIGAFRG